MLATLKKFLAQAIVCPVIEHGVRQEEQQYTYVEDKCLHQADIQPRRNQRHRDDDQSAFEHQRMQHPRPTATRELQAHLEAVEQAVENDVPGQRQQADAQRHRAHLHQHRPRPETEIQAHHHRHDDQPDQAAAAALAGMVLEKSGATDVRVEDGKVSFSGNLGPILTSATDDADNLYNNNADAVSQKYDGQPALKVAAAWWYVLSPCIKELQKQRLIAESQVVDHVLRRAVEKLENGMTGFLTQPVLSAQAVVNLKKTRETLGEKAKILAGIMPVVSQRNAIFMENEVNGIHVDAEIIERFAGLDRAQGEELGLEVSVKAAQAAAPYADGFYLMTPFNRVALMERLIARLRTEVTG